MDNVQSLRNSIAEAGAKLAELLVARLTPANRAKYEEHLKLGLGRIEIRVRIDPPGRPEAELVLVPNSAGNCDELVRF